jgi:membrane complex biogenesis BtpA family protein
VALRLRELFGVDRPIIAMLHLPAMPGRPRHDPVAGIDRLVDSVAHDVAVLQATGIDGFLFCNEADLPYQMKVGPEIAATMAAVIGRVRSEIRRPFGVDLVWDPQASLAVARATGAVFVREALTGVSESDLGLMQPDFGAIAGYRAAIGAESVMLFGNITPEFGSSLGRRDVAERAKSAAFLGLDAVLISGQITGTPLDLDELRAAKAAIPETPDGALVGTTLKVDADTWNAVDPDRAARFMDAARQAQQSVRVA